MQRIHPGSWWNSSISWWHANGTHWRTRAEDWTSMMRGWTQVFVVCSYILGSAWSLLMLLAGRDIKLLLFAFHFFWIGAIVLLLAYRTTYPDKFRSLLPPYVWALLMVVSAAVAFESLSNGNTNAAVQSGVIGTAGALAPLAVKAASDMWRDRLRRRTAARNSTSQPS